MKTVTADDHHRMRARRSMTIDQLREAMVTKSVLHEFAPSPYSWRFGEEKETTGAMVDGSLVDCLLTQPEAFDRLFVVSPYPDFRKKEAQEWRDSQKSAGRMIVTNDEIDSARRSVVILMEDHPEILSNAKFQVPIHVEASLGGTNVKVGCLPDILPMSGDYKDSIIDLKRTDDITPSGFRRTAARFGYDVQASLSLILSDVSGMGRIRFIFLVQSRIPPFETALYQIEAKDVARATEWTNQQLMRWGACLRSNRWPKATDGIQTISMPAWASRLDDEQPDSDQ